jgi:toxin YoeB
MHICFHDQGWEDYLFWQKHDKKLLTKINQLLKDIKRDPFNGIGKPEPLKYGYQGFWSRRINEEHRLVYMFEENRIIVAQCRYHYL